MRIVLVDDDKAIRESLFGFLTKYNHQVYKYDNGGTAFDDLHKRKPHLVMTDLKMPEMDGMQLLKKIKSSPKLKDTIVILFTGYGDIKNAVEAMKNGAYDYLQKPINIDELVLVLNRINEFLSLKEKNIQLTRNFEEKLNKATGEIKNELQEIRKAYAKEIGIDNIGIFSDKMRSVFKTAKKLHKNRNIAVFIEGETGTGKELIARYIHYGNGEIIAPFVALNCAAISPTLFESELFGYESGAFTGGSKYGQIGKIELAKGGSIFLDEISEINTEYQAKLLRVIQEKEYYRVGGLKKHHADVRFICSSNRDIEKLVDEGSFRKDLYYRLNVGRIKIPPLRERPEEILPLSKMFLKQLKMENRTSFENINKKTVEMLQEYSWPGNVRELKNIIDRASILSEDNELQPKHIKFMLTGLNNNEKKKIIKPKSKYDIIFNEKGVNLDDFILDIVSEAYKRNNNVKTETAKYLGISVRVLHTYLKRLKEKGVRD